MGAFLDHLVQVHLDALDGVGYVDDFANLRRIGKERNHLFPLPLPHGDHSREFLPPLVFGEHLHRYCSRLGSGRLEDWLEGCCQ